MVDVHHIIANVYGVEVVDCKLFALLHRTAHRHAVEPVKDFVVRVAADTVLIIYESVMDILPIYEFRHKAPILEEDGPEPFQLGFLLSVDVYFISAFNACADILGQQLEVLVERRLRRDLEHYIRNLLMGDGGVYIYSAEPFKTSEEFLVGVHIGRIQPNDCTLWKDICKRLSSFIVLGHGIGNDVHRVHLFLGKLGVAVKDTDFLYLIPKERYPVRIIE